MAPQGESLLEYKKGGNRFPPSNKGAAVQILHQTVGHHGVCNLDETGDIGADNIVAW